MSTLLRLPLVARLLLISLPIGRPSTLQLALMLVLRKEYPRWWFDFNLERSRFSARVGVYSALMTDQKPSTEEGPERISRVRPSRRIAAQSGTACGQMADGVAPPSGALRALAGRLCCHRRRAVCDSLDR